MANPTSKITANPTEILGSAIAVNSTNSAARIAIILSVFSLTSDA